MPEGGPAGSAPLGNNSATPLQATFYGRFLARQTIGLDRRQPLASTFAARYMEGRDAVGTDVIIWRESATGSVACNTVGANSQLLFREIVRFDEHENPNTFAAGQIVLLPYVVLSFPTTSRTTTKSSNFPSFNSPAGDISGWLYLNLDTPAIKKHPTQNWVVTSMTAGGFFTSIPATALGNGCSPAAPTSTVNGGNVPIGPAGGLLVCPAGFAAPAGSPVCAPGKPPFTGTNVNP